MAADSQSLSALMALSTEPCYSIFSPHTTVAQAMSDMVQHKRTAVAVLEKGKLKGLVTRTDVLAAVHAASSHQPLSGIMSRTLLVAGPGQSFRKALARMTRADIEHLPVVDDQKLITVLHQNDLLRHQIDTLNDDIVFLQEYIDGMHNARQD
jgi:signal-transduction protein with cAMP-binding, CBS, and nucleotidyltransferase domain